MVAYSFNKIFAPQVEAGLKVHTVRGHRKRHARPAEPVQLYTGMRTRHCRKLVEPDPVCTAIHDIRIEVGDASLLSDDWGPGSIEAIEINGRELNAIETELFARADGFDPYHLIGRPKPGKKFPAVMTARNLMGTWWNQTHGRGGWQGNIIYWAPSGVAVLK